MKPATLAARRTIEREHAVNVNARLIAEWEYNRFQVPEVSVTPAQTGDDEWLVIHGDPNTVAQPNRPRTGIARARLDSDKVKPLGKYRDTAQATRFYPANPDDPYTYWSSIQRSKLVQLNGAYEFDQPIEITVMYPETVAANKLVIGFETSYAKPISYSVEVTPNGTQWVTAMINTPIKADGTATVWYSRNEWDVTPDYEWPVVIKGVRLKVYSMNKPYSHLDVLQVGARLENDLSPFVVGYSVGMEVSERSFIAPLGSASSNTASVQLNNIDGRFNNYNPQSLYAGLIDKNVRFSMDLGIDARPQSGSKFEYIREFTMWTDSWGGQDQTSVSVSLRDSSAFLQEQQMPKVFFEDVTPGSVVWQVMDRCGYTNYAYQRATDDYGQLIPFYWPEDDETVWDAFSKLAVATQTAIYFDEWDVLQIRARKAMFSNKQVDWNFDAIQNGQKLPDVVSADVGHEMEANTVTITYKPAQYSDFQKGLPMMETAWEPEDETVLLRGSALTKDVALNATDIWINQGEVNFWPYESLINVRGEIMRYSGKEYGYYDAAGKLKKKVIKTLEEKAELDQLNEFLGWKNGFSGRLILTDRALFGSVKDAHEVSPGGYTSLITNWENTNFWPYTGGGIAQKEGYVQMTNATTANSAYHLRKHDTAVGQAQGRNTIWYGTKIRFPSDGSVIAQNDDEKGLVKSEKGPVAIGGLFFAGDWGDAGYFLDISPSLYVIGNEGNYRESKPGTRHELSLVVMPSDAKAFYAPSTYKNETGVTASGVPAAIYYDIWYTVDVRWTKLFDGTNRVQITVFLNGVEAGTWFVNPSQQPPNEYRFGHHVRAGSKVDFEYLYAVGRTEGDQNLENPDASAYLDLVSGGYTSGFIQRDYRYDMKHINPSYKYVSGYYYFPQNVYQGDAAFDEFGPVVHEVREFEVKFDETKIPVAHSNLYLTNNSQVETVYYQADAFSARFMLANASRTNAIVKGDDQISFGADDPVTQSMFIYGRSVYQDEEKVVTKTDEPSARKRGPTKVEVGSRFIQNEDMANELSQWILDLWASGVDEVTVETYGNPFLQLGDLVTLNYPVKGFYPSTHKYFVVTINKEYSEGYSSTVILRRARI